MMRLLDDPLVPEIAQKYLHDRPAHDKTAREWTSTYPSLSLTTINSYPSDIAKYAVKPIVEKSVAPPIEVITID